MRLTFAWAIIFYLSCTVCVQAAILDFEGIAADGTAGDPADRLTLAPRAVGLDDSDQPMGVQLVAARFREDILLAAAAEIESRSPEVGIAE